MTQAVTRRAPAAISLSEPSWYKDAVIYELHVRAFADADADGIGDFRGLTAKLDYLHDLGVTALWLLPFCPSPLRDDGYDISDYLNVHPSYGTLRDFKVFMREAHRRGMRVITELVVNHTSDQHPWFQRARQAPPGSSWRNFYVWSGTPDRYSDARIIFKDFEPSNWTWDSVAGAYYWHRFYSHQPDLNYDHPEVRKAVTRVLDFWLGMGVDGLRLDAVPYLIEREGTNCENLPETHDILKQLRQHMDHRYRDRLLLAEANQWPEDAVAYFGDGDEAHMAFHFPVMPRMFMAVRMEDRFPIVDILSQTPSIPAEAQWALFLRNHDELTLEMVTDEERDYMYRVYAHDPEARINLGIRRRLAPLLGNNRRRIELMNSLLFALPGTPVLYYGDEIGMGDNIYLGDRNGVRTPMQWSPDRNAGFSRANPQRLYLPAIVDPEYHYETVNVEAQQSNPHSMLWWMKRLIALRRSYRAFGRGTLEFLHPDNRKVLAFIRRYGDEIILVVANLSRFVQFVELNLHDYKGMKPVELFGRTEFPSIGENPYFLTFGPHSFYWFSLEHAAIPDNEPGDLDGLVPEIDVDDEWGPMSPGHTALCDALFTYAQGRRWFGGKARPVKSSEIVGVVPATQGSATVQIALLQVDYTDGDPETYIIPVLHQSGDESRGSERTGQHGLIARLRRQGDAKSLGTLHDATLDPAFGESLVDAIGRRRSVRTADGVIVGTPTPSLVTIAGTGHGSETLSQLRAGGIEQREQTNSSFVFGERLVLKLFRRLEHGVNPDLEIGRFLTAAGFVNTPPLAGAIEFRRGRSEPTTLAILQGYVVNEGDAWHLALDAARESFERALVHTEAPPPIAASASGLLALAAAEPSATVQDVVGPFLENIRRLGLRTAELHLALASDPTKPAFAPEPFSALYRRSLYQSMRATTDQTFRLLRQRLQSLPETSRDNARHVLSLEPEIMRRLRAGLEIPINALRIRCHGDYHLGQVLFTGNDFVIIDFEGEPARSITERRIKRTPLRDVAGMLRSFHYAATTELLAARGRIAGLEPEASGRLEAWAREWVRGISGAFLRAYIERLGTSPILPRDSRELEALLEVSLLEKAVYELGYELNNRPSWVDIPLHGLRELVGAEV